MFGIKKKTSPELFPLFPFKKLEQDLNYNFKALGDASEEHDSRLAALETAMADLQKAIAFFEQKTKESAR